MKRMVTAITIVSALALVGCDDNKTAKPAGSDLPPPPPADTVVTAPPPAQSTVVTPAPAPVPASPAAANSKGKTYTVQKGDTLYAISRKVYGDNTHVKALKEANPGLNPDQIKVGQVLTLP